MKLKCHGYGVQKKEADAKERELEDKLRELEALKQRVAADEEALKKASAEAKGALC